MNLQFSSKLFRKKSNRRTTHSCQIIPYFEKCCVRNGLHLNHFAISFFSRNKMAGEKLGSDKFTHEACEKKKQY